MRLVQAVQQPLATSQERTFIRARAEQLQYIGDTRIEALVSYAVSGDPRLAVQANEDALMHWCASCQIKARELNLVGYQNEDD